MMKFNLHCLQIKFTKIKSIRIEIDLHKLNLECIKGATWAWYNANGDFEPEISCACVVKCGKCQHFLIFCTGWEAVD